jgi:hypothetical protein
MPLPSLNEKIVEVIDIKFGDELEIVLPGAK